MDYISRHIGPTDSERAKMLDIVGYGSIQELVDAAMPPGILAKQPLNLPPALTEKEAQNRLRELAAKNTVLRAFYARATPPP